MELPHISIVTPSFNQAKYLPETIKSILNQNYPNLEYIIMDGGSTDGSVEIIKKYESRLTYWISETDRGQSHAVMKGFEKGTGELFAWVNSDDVLFPGSLKTIAESYLAGERPDIIHTNICYIDSQGNITRFVRVPRQNRFFFCRGVWYGQAPTVFFKSSLFHNVGGLNEDYHLSMDFDIWVRMIATGAHIVHIPRYLGGFRWHESSKTVQELRRGNSLGNPESQEICNVNFPMLTDSKRILWRYVYKLYQLLNLNYFREYKDLKLLKCSRRWNQIDTTFYS